MTGTGDTAVPALILLWAANEPHRAAEVALLDEGVAATWLLGRHDDTPDDSARRALFVRQRPGESTAGGGLTGKGISRRQLLLRPVAGGVDVENVGKVLLFIDGHRVEAGVSRRAEAGAILVLRAHSVFLLSRRPALLPAVRGEVPLQPFGEPDADGMVGESPAAWTLRSDLAIAAQTPGHVLVHGPGGAGKELAARSLHRLSARAGAFVPLDTSTLTPDVGDATLFGDAAGGTLFVDETDELSAAAWARLRRAMASGADVRIVVATRRAPAALGPDLRERFAHVVEVPPLAARLEDVPLIARSIVLGEHRAKNELAAPFVQPGEEGRLDVAFAPGLAISLLRSARGGGSVRDLRELLLRAMTETRDPPLLPPDDGSLLRTQETVPPPSEGDEDAPTVSHGAGGRVSST